jgi:hypothetical protein
MLCFLLLLCISAIVTAISYAQQPDSDCFGPTDTTPNPSKPTKICKPITTVEGSGKMSATQFGFEFFIFVRYAYKV